MNKHQAQLQQFVLLNRNNRVSDRKWNKKNLETLKLIEEKKKRNKEQKEIEKELQYQKRQQS